MRLLVLISFGIHHMEGAVWIGGVWCGILWLANDVDNNNDDNVLWNSDGGDDGHRGGVMEEMESLC